MTVKPTETMRSKASPFIFNVDLTNCPLGQAVETGKCPEQTRAWLEPDWVELGWERRAGWVRREEVVGAGREREM